MMKKSLLSLLFLLSNYLVFQSQTFTYQYQFIPDSTATKNKVSQLMILNINKDQSEFYSLEKMKIDSTLLDRRNKGNNDPRYTQSEYISTYRILKYPNEKILDHKLTLGITSYLLKDDREINWKLESEFAEILGYKVQKATTTFGGRKWIAYFTKAIPFPDGPYKFRGLPGLIVKVADENDQHVFELIGVKNSAANFVYPSSVSLKDLPSLDYNMFKKKFKEYRGNPAADLMGSIPDQPDRNGNMKTGTEIWLEISKREKDKLKKDNNILEIDLLR
ncbi:MULTISPECIES: GLPGLI family protein [unclassified Kaistella]|uniref:GLPGLI family protein n=1 Tax=unclassified Kaistella TaxID=2762626 RepID=UPI002736B4BD|nr:MULTISPECIES: GLPGLI family protein [unclassified Kaistella]MDP2454789.1 GLPGLI family protein [Kaistella sp. SH11-4b]MDP2457526.1 GLPGLI family protein [Kaistella sp. SH40-3]MDP2460286.1 GLPGLI family protein [Kaistella sp. SH19-2b]